MARQMYSTYIFQKLSVFQHPIPLYSNISLEHILIIQRESLLTRAREQGDS
jgi:hypothetical protein